MTRIIRLFEILLILQLFYQQVFCQKYLDDLGDAIEPQVQTLYGKNFEVHIIVFIDSSLNTRPFPQGSIEDPYGTLHGCTIFTAENSNRAFVGVFKNGHIIWHSDTIINVDDLYRHTLLATTDLNNDGFVEIITSWIYGMRGGGEGLWIFSWNGQNGTIINDYDKDNLSIVFSYEGLFKLVDINADGIFEIQGIISPETPNQKIITYSWNGQKYSNWSSTPQPPPGGYLPKNKLDVNVKSDVKKKLNNMSYIYHMCLENMPTSIQAIDKLLLLQKTDSLLGITSPQNWTFSSLRRQLFGWRDDLISPNPISKGKIESSFEYESKGLPSTLPYYIQAANIWFGEPSVNRQTLEFPEEAWYQDIVNNSKCGITIGPADPPNPFVPLNFLDTLIGYTTQSRSLGWIKDQTTATKYLGYFSSAKTNLQQNNVRSTRATLQRVLQDVNTDSTSLLTSEAYALIRYNTEYLLAQIPPPPSGCNVKLVNSTGTKLTGGALQYYESAWKDATNNNDGTFNITTNAKTLSLRMTYEYGTQTKSNVTVGYDTVVFQTVNAQIQLQNSSGNLILAPLGDQGSVQYYSGAWRNFGTTTNGVANKELLPNNYSFKMTYAYASKDKQQDLSTNPTVVFQTVNAAVQLQNSQGSLMPAPLGDQGTVQYYSGAWRDFGITSNGIANKELLPNNYSFKMTYAYASKDRQQDISTNPTVVFQTLNAAVQIQNSQGSLMPAPLGDQGTVQYYSGAWRDFGVTTNGVSNKELLPNNYSFRITYAYASKDKQQDLSTNPTVIFQTVNAAVQLQNSQGSLMPAPLGDQGTVQYYSGAWRDFGVTTNGVSNKELLPNNYSFRITYAYASKDKQQDLSTNSTVVFQTVNAAVQLKNSQGALMPAPSENQGTVQYYSGAWRSLGTTSNGTVTKELLPNNYSFRMTYEYVSLDKAQDLSTNSTVSFSTVLCTIRVKNTQGQLVDGALASYYSGAPNGAGWRQIGNTVNGIVTKELLPVNLSFRVKYGTQQQDKQQNLSTNNIVEFAIQ